MSSKFTFDPETKLTKDEQLKIKDLQDKLVKYTASFSTLKGDERKAAIEKLNKDTDYLKVIKEYGDFIEFLKLKYAKTPHVSA